MWNPTMLDSSPTSTTIWLTLGKSVPLFRSVSPVLNLGTETYNLCSSLTCKQLCATLL